MSDDNAPVVKALRHAHRHAAAVRARREAVQALAALHLSEAAQTPGGSPTDPTEAPHP